MINCDLEFELRKLKRSSYESVANAEEKSKDDKYFHVRRPIEDELKSLLLNVNRYCKKSLVLLCGSAGDGKSHLLSYLQYYDDLKLIEDYEIYNDASESDEPQKTAIQTLASRLTDFDDEHIDLVHERKMILAINLGTLSKFIESEYGERYTKLRDYVEKYGIVYEYSEDIPFDIDSPFQHISFSDYHMFELTEQGGTYKYLDELIEKVVSPDDENPFYQKYLNCEKCPHHKMCPIKHNFEFLDSDDIQDSIEYCLMEVEFKDKVILSTRDILDFIYKIIVPPDFTTVILSVGSSSIESLTYYINSTTPTLLFESDNSSVILDCIIENDPLRKRTSKIDSEAIRIHSSEKITPDYSKMTHNTPYDSLGETFNLEIINDKEEIKQKMFNFLIRLKALKDNLFKTNSSDAFVEFIRFLYYQNLGDIRKLKELYKIVQKGIMKWNGEFDDDYVCIDHSHRDYWILEELKIKADIDSSVQVQEPCALVRYVPYLTVQFKQVDDRGKGTVLDIDYSLYELLRNMENGYFSTAHDRNTHTDFDSYVRNISEYGDMQRKVVVKEKDSKRKLIFSDSGLDYEFKVEV